jgi:peptide/nickel transport system substrate-binding protein
MPADHAPANDRADRVHPSRREFLLAGLSAAALAAVGGTTAQAATRTIAAAPGRGRTTSTELQPIIVALDSVVDLLDPQAFRTFGAQTVTASLYAPLLSQEFEVEAETEFIGTSTYGPGLAESVEFSEDRTTVTFTLRADAAFADGTPITVDDVLWTFERSIVGPGYIKALLPFIGIESMDQITRGDGENTIVFTPSVASPLFERFIALQAFGIMPKAVGEENATADDEWAFQFFHDASVASAAYNVTSFERDTQVVLEPNPGYFNAAEVKNAGVTARNVTNADQRALLVRSGDIDLAQGVPPQQLADLEGDDSVVIHRQPSISTNFVGLNCTMEPFTDAAVRQAVAKAIPYQVLIDEVMQGYASPAGNLVVANMDTHAGIVFETDVEGAKALLEGVDVGGAIPLSVKQSSARDQRSAVFIQDALREVGIDVEIQVLPDAEFVENLNAKSLQLFIHEWLSWGGDPYYQMQFLAGTDVFTNFVAYSNPDLDALLAEGLFELDAEKRAEISAQCQQILYDDAPIIPLLSPDWVVVAAPGISGIAKGDDEKLRFELISKA